MSSNILTGDFGPVNALCEKMFDREKLLTDAGIKSFTPQLRFIENFCQSPEEILEYKQFQIDMAIMSVSKDKKRTDRFRELIEKRKKCAKETGNIWDQRPTAFERRYEQLRYINDAEEYDLKLSLFSQTKKMWQEEVVQYSEGYVDRLAAQLGRMPSKKSVCKIMLGERLKEFGYKYDKDLSDYSFMTFSKPIAESYKLCWILDSEVVQKKFNLNSIYYKLKSTGELKEIEASGGQFDSFISLRAAASQKDERPLLSFGFRDFFPIGNRYRNFRSPQELEALINIYAKMYSMIQKELEAAIQKLVESMKSGTLNS